MANLVKWWEDLQKNLRESMTPREKRKDERDTRKFNRQIKKAERKNDSVRT